MGETDLKSPRNVPLVASNSIGKEVIKTEQGKSAITFYDNSFIAGSYQSDMPSNSSWETDEYLKSLIESRWLSSKLKILDENSSEIHDLLADVENEVRADEAYRVWLNNLEDLDFDMGNLLGDVAVEVTQFQLIEESYNKINNNKKVLKFIPTAIVNYTRQKHDKEVLLWELLGGQKHDKEVLLWELLGGNETCTTNNNVLSIVGMREIGKTTLAKLLYNDSKVKDHFEVKGWLSISGINFD
nr:hypothetical protein [Tanacetum cinerariifolium]